MSTVEVGVPVLGHCVFSRWFTIDPTRSIPPGGQAYPPEFNPDKPQSTKTRGSVEIVEKTLGGCLVFMPGWGTGTWWPELLAFRGPR